MKAINLELNTNIQDTNSMMVNNINLQLLINNHQGWVWAKDMQGRILFVNQAYADFFKLPIEDIVGKTDYDFHPKEAADFYRSHDFQLYETQTPFLVEEEILYNGQLIIAETYKSPLYNSDNELIGSVGFNRDITNLKNLENQNRKLLKAIEQSTATFVITDVNGTIEYVNPQFTVLTGYSKDEAIGLNPRVLKSDLTPEETYKSLWSNITAGKEWHGEFCNRKKNGDLFWESVVISPIFDDAGAISNYVAVKEDITGVKEASRELVRLSTLQDLLVKLSLQNINISSDNFEENIYQSLFEISEFLEADRALIFKYDWEKNICFCEYEWHLSNLTPIKDELKSVDLNTMMMWVDSHKQHKNFAISDVDLYTGDTAENLQQRGIQSLISVPIYIGERCAGFISFDSLSCKHIYSEKENALLQVFGQLYSSLVQRFELEQTLKSEMIKAQTANKTKSEFLANMSHELRTPLNGVIGFSELLMETKTDDVQLQYTSAINKSAKSLLNVINDILDFSKIEAGKLELDIVKTDMVQLIENAIDIIKHGAEKKGLELLLNIPDNLARFAYIDPIRVSQILINLLSNAIKFTIKGEVELKVAFNKIADERGVYTFSVRDTGIGINDEQKLKLFKAFSQADSSTTRVFGGTGLGLSISQKLANKMDSSIQYESKLNGGSVFHFSIEAECEINSAVFKEKIYNIKRVLVIDDNQNSRISIQRMLHNWGIEVVTCESASEAVFIIQISNAFDLIIVDNSVHCVNGLQSIRLICNKLGISVESQNFLLLHASSDDYQFHNECEQVGVKYLIEKPLRYDEVFNYLSNINVEQPKPIKSTNTLTDSEPMQRNLKFLVADDDIFNMMLAKAMLNKISPGVEITEAVNGKIAYDKVIENNFDLVFMDVQMPEMDGNEATMAIRKYEKGIGKHTIIIGLTAGALEEERRKCIDSGMDEFLTKPIDSTKLSDTINRLLNL
ncbi:MAG: response regulator [Paludibacter sp.]|nr:response regulator [Paludibacter sp.]